VSAAIIIAAIAFLGLSLGSFSSAIAYRLPRGESWIRKGSGEAARSRCPNCSTQLTLFDLVPVMSWVALRGKCRYCQAKISPLYPALELLGGVLAVLFFFTYGASLLLLLALGLLPFFLAVLIVVLTSEGLSSENGSCPCCALCSAEYGGACLFPLGFGLSCGNGWFVRFAFLEGRGG
jgi:prepilin signal peptidase PulO-like enzyme (type II secretory pathway)